MEYEKKVRIIIIVLLAAVLFVVSWKFLFPIAKYVFFYITPFNTTDDIYKQTWQSKDGKICFTASELKQMFRSNSYQGTYSHNNEVIQVDIVITSGFSEVRKLTKYSYEPAYCIYTGKGNYNIFTEEYVVQVEGADAEISDYKSGDVIVFQKVNSTQR